jgi:inhibitor of KinA
MASTRARAAGHRQQRDPVRFLAAGEQGLVVELGDRVDPELNERVHLLAAAARRSLSDVVSEVVPTYRSLLLVFDPLRVRRARLVARVEELLDGLARAGEAELASRLVHVPVAYGGELGPDLEEVARHARVAPNEAVALHSSAVYRVHMLGFTPGFPYLGGTPERLAIARLESPRERVPAGSIGIAGAQTGIYPIDSPGGWRIVGRTPLRLFDPAAERPFLMAAGDRVRFHPVPAARWAEVARQVAAGAWTPEVAREGGA